MADQRSKIAFCGLQWTLGIVILIESVLLLLPSAAHDFARTHMPNAVRLVLGCGEIVGSVMLLIPRTAIRGAWFLAAVFLLAIVIHLLHGIYNVGNLAIYTAAAWAIAVGKGK
ncbi:MAG: DoxX family protein [Candidatus Sulfotelmatobacter sp.]